MASETVTRQSGVDGLPDRGSSPNQVDRVVCDGLVLPERASRPQGVTNDLSRDSDGQGSGRILKGVHFRSQRASPGLSVSIPRSSPGREGRAPLPAASGAHRGR